MGTAQRGDAFGGSAPRGKRPYHSRAARDDRDGALPLQGDTSGGLMNRKQGGTVELEA